MIQIVPSCIAFAQAIQAALYPGTITSRAETRVNEHRVVERRPFDRGATPAEPATVGSLPLAGTTLHREFSLVGIGEEAEGANGGGGCCGEEEQAAAEVRRDTSHGLELPPYAGAAAGFHDRV